MKFTFIFVLGSFQFGAAPEQAPRDPWFGKDKLYHFVGSAVIQSAGHSLGRAAGLDYREASWIAAGLTLSVGVGKELHDRADGRFFSWRDVAADVSGGGVGAVVVRQVDR